MTRTWLLAVSLTALVCAAESRSAQGNVLVVDDGPHDYGAVWLFDLEADGSLDSLSELSTPVEVSDHDFFGAALAPLGDLNNDGTQDLVVGTPGEDRGCRDCGALWILFRAPDGSVAARHALRPGRNFEGDPELATRHGWALASLGDLDGNGSLELALGASQNASSPGRVWILSLEPDGSVSRELVIAEGVNGFGGDLDVGDGFGSSLAALGDLDGDGVTELGVGSIGDDDGGSSRGALWILFLAADGTVAAEQKISNTAGGFPGGLDGNDAFGSELAPIGDLDGNGVIDIAVGAPGDDDGGFDGGAVWVLQLASDGTVLATQKLSKTSGGLGAHSLSRFGAALAPAGDLDSDGLPDLCVGADSGDTGGVFVLLLNADGTVGSSQLHTTAFPGIATNDALGTSLAALGDWDLDGRPDFAVGARYRDGAPPPPDFTSLADALAAAAAGDTILLRGGDYGSAPGTWSISAKSLTLQALNPLNVRLSGGLEISDLSASQSVRLSGLDLRGGIHSDEDPPLRIADNQGVVWVDDCVVPKQDTFVAAITPGILIDASARVVLNRCRVTGMSSPLDADFDVNVPPPAALFIAGASAVHAYDCTITGTTGLCDTDVLGFLHQQPGGNAIVTTSFAAFLFLSGCEVRGGSGEACGCESGGRGIQSLGQTKVLDSSVAGGSGCPSGGAFTGSVTFLDGERLAMAVDNPRRESEDTLFFLEGPPEVAVFVSYALVPDASYRPARFGSDVLGSPRVLDYLGRTDASGKLVTFGQQNDPPPGFEILRVFAQSFSVQPSTPTWTTKVSPVPRPIRLGAAAMLTRLDSGF